MARLTSSPKADVRFGTAAPGELGYVVLYQSPAVWWPLMLQHTVSSKWQGGTCVEHISLVILGGPSLLTGLI